MLYSFYVYAAANTPKASAATFKLSVSRGILTKVTIVIPTGHHGLAHLVIRDGNTPFVPEGGEDGIIGDGVPVVWEGWKEIKETPYALYADVWNEDDTYLHGFIVYMTILPRHVAQPLGRLVDLLSRLIERFRIFRV